MRIFILCFLVVFTTHAHDPRTLDAGLAMLSNPAESANNFCPIETSESWCEDLASSVCSSSRTAMIDYKAQSQEKKNELAKKLPPDASSIQIKRGHMEMVAKTEAEVTKKTKITKEDLRNLATEARTAMIRQVNSTSIGSAQKAQMVNRLSSVSFSTGPEFVDKERRRLLANNPDMSEEEAESSSISFYTDLCGETGLVIDAYFDAANNSFIVCPGMIQSMFDFGGSKEKALIGLQTPIAHEVAHAIDGQDYEAISDRTDSSIYASMKTCHETSNPELMWELQAGEIVADFWAGKVLAEQYKNQNLLGRDLMNNFSLGSNGQDLCLLKGNNAHPSGSFRINNIFSRDPDLRARLNCSEPSVKKPYCGLNGTQPSQETNT